MQQGPENGLAMTPPTKPLTKPSTKPLGTATPAFAAHAARRTRLAQRLREAGGGLAVLPTAVERLRNGDSPYAFRHDSSFFYLTGFVEPQAWLVVEASGRSRLLCRPRDPDREIWDGHRLGPEAAVAALGVDEAYPIEALDTQLPGWLENQPAVWFPFEGHEGLATRLQGWLAQVRERAYSGVQAPTQQHDLNALVDGMRLFKDAPEIDAMRRAGAVGAAGHVRAMQACRPGLREYQLEAELLHAFRHAGASGPAYESIVAAGANACVLHHPAGHAELRDGELCLIDAGCEVDSYASDITRTFPVNGRFSAPQRALYDAVLAAQAAALAVTRPGHRKIDGHWAAVRTLSEHLLGLGLLSSDRHGSVDDIVERGAYRRFYMHGTGHWLGLDVHDPGEYLALDEPVVEQLDGRGGRSVKHPSRVLQPGIVLTVEPGLYVQPAPDVPEAYWHLGVRIEDDVLITPDGHELLSRGAPVQPDEIEALMRG